MKITRIETILVSADWDKVAGSSFRNPATPNLAFEGLERFGIARRLRGINISGGESRENHRSPNIADLDKVGR
jgi:hypothetical protein